MDQFIEKAEYFQKNNIPFLFIISYDKKNFFIDSINNLENQNIFFSFETDNYGILKNFNEKDFFSNKKYIDNCSINSNINIKIKDKISYEDYKIRFFQLKKHFEMGNSFLANLTFPTELEECDLYSIFAKSKAKYKLFFNNLFIVQSPETFVIIKGNKIYTYPMKGTINALIENAEEKLLNDEKEFAEHITVVDLLRNDLGIVCDKVEVKRFRYIVPVFSNNPLLQTVSEIEGILNKKYINNYGELLDKILPAGSVTGAPKKKTVEILEEIENSYNSYNRGWYCGVFGIVINGDLYSSVMIRFIEKNGNKYFYKSGGGITIYSNCEDEYKELFEKIYV